MNGKVAVVTGGSNGIGQAVVEELRRRGCHVAILDRELNGDVHDRGNTYLVDIADTVAARRAVDDVAHRHGGIDYLVNVAGSFIAAGEDATAEDWTTILAVNVHGNAAMVSAAAPHMRQRGGGAIVNIGSVSGHVGQPHRWTYNATKGAIQSMTRCQALDLAPDNIRVNVVSPGWIWTREVRGAADIAGDAASAWNNYALLGRLGEPVEVARAVAFLLSDDASFITGADIPVDGGYLAMGPEGPGTTSTFAGSA